MLSDQTTLDTEAAETELTSLLGLIASIAGMDASIEARRRALCEGVGQRIGACGWMWTIGQVDPDSNAPMSLGYLYGGLSADQAAALINAPADPQPCPLDIHLAQAVQNGAHFSCFRQQLVDDEQWYSNPNVRLYRLRQGIDHCIYSITPLEGHRFSGIGFYRAVGAGAFGEAQRRVVHIVTGEVRWLCRPATAGTPFGLAAGLSPRLRSVLSLLIDGENCEEIASLLCLSPQTVKGYMKQIYAALGVTSHPKLMRLFRH